MKSFELYEAYLKQNEGQAKLHAVYREKAEKARAAVEAAKVKADEVVHSEIASGVDKTSEKAAARKAIAKSEQELSYALEEQQKAYAYDNPDKIRDVDVVQAWLKEYKPAVDATDMAGIKERVKLGRDLLLSALYDHYNLRQDYHGITEDIQQISDTATKSGRQNTYIKISHPIGNLVSAGFSADELAQHISQILRGDGLPATVKYMKEVGK